jgi:hypothetical protein
VKTTAATSNPAAFIYDIATDTFLPDIVFPGAAQTSAYGIWWNGGTTGANLISTDAPIGVSVTGLLISTANSTFILEFFANYTYGPSGRFLLGSLKVTTNSSGIADFEFIGKVPPVGAGFITATATDADGNTSEFPTTSRSKIGRRLSRESIYGRRSCRRVSPKLVQNSCRTA